jgi:hypothetical protein
VFLKEHLALVKTFLQEHFYLTNFVQTRWGQMFLQEHFGSPLDNGGGLPHANH